MHYEKIRGKKDIPLAIYTIKDTIMVRIPLPEFVGRD